MTSRLGIETPRLTERHASPPPTLSAARPTIVKPTFLNQAVSQKTCSLEGRGRRSDAVSVRSTGEAKLFGEFAGVKEVRRIALIKHFVGFRD